LDVAVAVDREGERLAAVDVEQRALGVLTLRVERRALGDVEHGVAGVAVARRRVDLEVSVVEVLADGVGVGRHHHVEVAAAQAVGAAILVDRDDRLDGVEVRQLLAGDAVRPAPVVRVAHGLERVSVAG
jgi:hypothetical protein